MLTEREKYLFDLHGFLHLRDVVAPDDLSRMLELSELWQGMSDDELPPPLESYKDAGTTPTQARAIQHIEYADEVFQRLILNKKIMRPILALTRNCPKSLLSVLTTNTRESDDIAFHGGHDGGWRNPANDYQVADGEVFASFLAVSVSLVDVPQGTGFVCIPGSHKSGFPTPDDIDIYTEPPTVINVCPKAGDAIIFTEALRHGGRRWTADYPRRTVFIRYSTAYASWDPGRAVIEEHEDKLCADLRELKEIAGYRSRKKVVDRLLEEIGDESD